MAKRVLVRAYGDEPLERVLIEARGRVAFVANPASVTRIATGESSPVGFPLSDVFSFDEKHYCQLRSEWSQGKTSGWSHCRPLRVSTG